MKITLLGCGYVGLPLAKHWQSQGHSLTLTTTRAERLPELAPHGRALQIRGDEGDRLIELLQDQECLTVIVAPGQGRSPEGYRHTYLTTAETLAQVLPHCPQLTQVIYTSSYSVIGDHQGQWTDETTPPKPGTPNSQILYATEQVYLGLQSPQRRVCVLRLGGIYGPDREIHHIFRAWFGTIRPGDGSEYHNWIHQTDIIQGIDFARQKRLTGLFNLVNDLPIQKRDLLAQLAEKYRCDPVQWDPSQPSPRSQNAQVSNQKLRSLGLNLSYPAPQL